VLVQVEALLLPSVAMSVTVLGPRLAQVKLVGIAASEGVPQLSRLLFSTSAGVMLALPLPSSQIEMF
jgi:SpoU rRNA methylase family enzyme